MTANSDLFLSRIDFCRMQIVVILALVVEHIQSISDFDYVIILCGAMFDFADFIENGILSWNVQFTIFVFCPLAIIIHEIQIL